MLAYDFADTTTGEQKAVFDLAWPDGIQEELSQPVVVLLNEGAETIAIASQSRFPVLYDDSRVSAVRPDGGVGRGDGRMSSIGQPERATQKSGDRSVSGPTGLSLCR